MEAGRDLDALVAEKVMGFRLTQKEDGPELSTHPSLSVRYLKTWYRDSDGESYTTETLPHFSTDIAAAWEVVLALAKRGLPVQIYAGGSADGADWTVTFTSGSDGNEYAPTAPLAICKAALAALKAVGG